MGVMPRHPPPKGELWGGPAEWWAKQRFAHKAFSTWAVPQTMHLAGPGSNIPEGLWGVFWMDQYGASSIAKDPSYPFKMVGSPEVLASFGDASYESDTGCVTPVPCYGGARWAFTNNEAGRTLVGMHLRQRNTLSFCFRKDGNIQIYQKVLDEYASLGPVPVGGSTMAGLLGFESAGDKYSWTPRSLMDLKMVKTSWGWDRVTYVLKSQEKHSWLVKQVLDELESMMPESHYPLIQIVDGHGRPTEYYAEFLQWMGTQTPGSEMLLNMPA